jgi:hypothetical protein
MMRQGMGHNDSLNSSIDSRRNNNYKMPPSNNGNNVVLRTGSIDSSIDFKNQRNSNNVYSNAMSIPQTPS